MSATTIISNLNIGEIINIRLGNPSDFDYCPSAKGIVLKTTPHQMVPSCVCVVKEASGRLIVLPFVTVNQNADVDKAHPAFYATSAIDASEELNVRMGNTYATSIKNVMQAYAGQIANLEPHYTANEKRENVKVAVADVKTTDVSAPAVTAAPRKIRSAFQIVYEDEKIQSIPFNSAWNNGTGYFDGAIEGPDAVKLEIGEVVKTTTPLPNNRKLLFVGTRFGAVCLFQRFTDNYETIVGQLPDGVRRLDLSGMGSAYSPDMQAWILGPWGDNIGQWIEKMASMFNPPRMPVVPEPRDFKNGMTVKELKDMVRDWPVLDGKGGLTEVWVQTEKGLSSPVKSVWPLNATDMILYHTPE